MIYRLWNTAEHRYATAEEMKFLRVNAGGCVEMLDVLTTDEGTSISDYNRVKNQSIMCFNEEDFASHLVWQPAPDWEVVYGKVILGHKIYTDDTAWMLEDDGITKDERALSDYGDLLCFETECELYRLSNSDIGVIGNAHEESK
jgi:hypothetical protein